MGMTYMFSDYADFSGISNTPMKVGKVVQKSFIEVNEGGSEATAFTCEFPFYYLNTSMHKPY